MTFMVAWPFLAIKHTLIDIIFPVIVVTLVAKHATEKKGPLSLQPLLMNVKAIDDSMSRRVLATLRLIWELSVAALITLSVVAGVIVAVGALLT